MNSWFLFHIFRVPSHEHRVPTKLYAVNRLTSIAYFFTL
jgi:hypothetical protein